MNQTRGGPDSEQGAAAARPEKTESAEADHVRDRQLICISDRNQGTIVINCNVFDSIEKGGRSTNNKVAKAYLGVDQLFSAYFEECPITKFDIDTMAAEELLRQVGFHRS